MLNKTVPQSTTILVPPEELRAITIQDIHDALGGNGWAYSNYGDNELEDCADKLNSVLALFLDVEKRLAVAVSLLTAAQLAEYRELTRRVE